MKKTKYYSVIVISIIIIIHLIATFLKVNADYFKYNYKFDEAEIVEAEVAYRQRRSIKQSSDRINLWFEYDGKTHSQECWRGLFEFEGDKTNLYVVKIIGNPHEIIFVRGLIIPNQVSTYLIAIVIVLAAKIIHRQR